MATPTYSLHTFRLCSLVDLSFSSAKIVIPARCPISPHTARVEPKPLSV